MEEDTFSCGQQQSCDLVVLSKQILTPRAAVLSPCSADISFTGDGTGRNALLASASQSDSLVECSENADVSSCKNNVYNNLPDSEPCVSNGRVVAVGTHFSGNVEDRTMFVPENMQAATENLTANEHIGFIRGKYRNKDLDTASTLSEIQISPKDTISENAAATKHMNSGVEEPVKHSNLQAPTHMHSRVEKPVKHSNLQVPTHMNSRVEPVKHSNLKAPTHMNSGVEKPVKHCNLEASTAVKHVTSGVWATVEHVNSGAEIMLHNKDSILQTDVHKTIVNGQPSSLDIPPASLTASRLNNSFTQIQKQEVHLLQQDADLCINTAVHSSAATHDYIFAVTSVADRSQEINSNLQEGNHETSTNPEFTKEVESTATACVGREEIGEDKLVTEQDNELRTYPILNYDSFHIRNGLKRDNSNMDIAVPKIISHDQGIIQIKNTKPLGHVENSNSGIQPISLRMDVDIDAGVHVSISENDSTCKDSNKLYEKYDVGADVDMWKLGSAVSLNCATSASECNHVDSEMVCSLCLKIQNTVHLPPCEHSDDSSLSCTEQFKSTSEDSILCASRQQKPLVDAGSGQRGGVDEHLENQPCVQIKKCDAFISHETCSVFGKDDKKSVSVGEISVDVALDNFVSGDNILEDVSMDSQNVKLYDSVNENIDDDADDTCAEDGKMHVKDIFARVGTVYEKSTSSVETIGTKLSPFGGGDQQVISTDNIDVSLGSFVSEKGDTKGERGTSMGKSVGDDKTIMNLARSIDDDKTIMNLARSIDDDKTIMNFSKSIDDKTDGNFSKSIDDGKTIMNFSKSIDDKTDGNFSKSIDDGKTDGNFSKSIGDKIDGNFGKSIDDKTDGNFGKSIDDGKSDGNFSKSIDDDKTDGNFSKSIDDDKIDMNLSKSIDDGKTDGNFSKSIGDKTDGNFSKSIDDDKTDWNFSKSIDDGKTDWNFSKSIDDGKTVMNLDRSIGDDKTDMNLGMSIDDDKTDMNLGRSIDDEQINAILEHTHSFHKVVTKMGTSVGDKKTNMEDASMGNGKIDEKFDTNPNVSVSGEAARNVDIPVSGQKYEKTGIHMNDFVFNETIDTSLSTSVNDEKIDTNSSTSVGCEKIYTNSSTSVGCEKIDTNLSTSVGCEKIDTSLSTSVNDEKIDTNVSTSLGHKKTDNNMGTSVRDVTLDTGLDTAVRDERTDTNSCTSVGDETLDTIASTLVGDKKLDTIASTLVGDKTLDTIASTLVGDETLDTIASTLVGDETLDTSASTLVGDETLDTNASTLVGETLDTNAGTSVGDETLDTIASTLVGDETLHTNASTLVGDKTLDTNASTLVGDKTLDTNASTLVGDKTLDTNASTLVGDDRTDAGVSIYISDGDDSNFSIYVSDGDDSILDIITVSDAEEETHDTPEVAARKLPKLMVILKRCDAGQPPLDDDSSETESSDSHTSSKIPQNRKRSSDGSLLANCDDTTSGKRSSDGSLRANCNNTTSGKRSLDRSLKANCNKRQSYESTHKENGLSNIVEKASHESQKSSNSKRPVGRPVTGSNTARKRTTVYTKQFTPLSKLVHFNQNKKINRRRRFNLRSRDVTLSLRSKTSGITTRSSQNDKTCGSSADTLAQTKTCGSSGDALAQTKRTTSTKVKHKPPPESPPLNPTLPFLEVDLDIELDESQFFKPIDPALENTSPPPPPPQKKKRGRKPKHYNDSAGSNSADSSGSQVAGVTGCDPSHGCCQKALAAKSDMATQWEDPSRWYAALEARAKNAMQSLGGSTDNSYVPQMTNLQEDQNYEQLNQQYLLKTEPCDSTDNSYVPQVTNLQEDQNYEQLNQQYLLKTEPGDSTDNSYVPQVTNLQGDQNYEQLSQRYLPTYSYQNTSQHITMATRVPLAINSADHLFIPQMANLQGDQNREQLNQCLPAYLYQNTSQDIKMAACAPLASVFSEPGTVSGDQGNLLPTGAIPIGQPRVQSSHLFEPASSSPVPLFLTAVHQTSQNLGNSLNSRYSLQPDIHSHSPNTHANNNHLNSWEMSSHIPENPAGSTKDSHTKRTKSSDTAENSSSSTKDTHTKHTKSSDTVENSSSSTKDSHTKHKKCSDIPDNSALSTKDLHTRNKKSSGIPENSPSSTKDSPIKRKKSSTILKNSTKDSHQAASQPGPNRKRKKVKKTSNIKGGLKKSRTDDDSVVIVIDDAASDSSSDGDVVCIE